MTKTKKLLNKALLVRMEAMKQMEIDYPIGSEVSWEHGDHIRRGEIESYAYDIAIMVRTATGRLVNMDITKVRE